MSNQDKSTGKNLITGRGYFDFPLAIIIALFLTFGLIMIYSTSYYSSSIKFEGYGLYYLKKQFISTVIGILLMIVTYFFPYEFYKKLALPAYIVAFIMILLIFTPLSHSANGATRWIMLFGVSVQVAEVAKLAVIVSTATLIAKMTKAERASWRGVLFTLFPAALLSGMIVFITDDFSSGVVIGGIAFFMLCMAVPKNYRAYIVLGIVAIFGAIAFVMIVKGVGSKIWGFRGERILAWLDPQKYIEGRGFQPLQALYGIGSGGMLGKGLGKSVQKLGNLPEAHNDMIFSIICEELGIVGGFLVLLLFALLLWRLKDISSYTTDYYGNLIITGVFSHIAIQAILNIAVVTSLIPNTGISLPFISYGGSSVILLLVELGIVMNIAKNIDFGVAAERQIRKERKNKKVDAE